jgi:dTDP-4-amino-4,6-dideoxygalactose transaminase
MNQKKAELFKSWPNFSQEEANKAKDILLTNKVNYWSGEECRKFEKEFAEYVQCKYAVATSNGTTALDLAFKAMNLDAGSEVLVTSRTFLASVSSIINAGLVPKFIDVSRDTQNIDVSKLENVITSKTKAILCVHLAGWPCDMDEIMCIANLHSLFVIEDCAQAHGAKYKGRPLGSIGHIGCWSFCQDKIMTTAGEGGMVATDNKEYWSKMWSYKDHGKSYDAVYNTKHNPGFKWLHDSLGTNWRMTEIQGAIGRIQLTKMESWSATRNKYLAKIWNACSCIDALRVPKFKCLSCTGCNQENACIHGAYKCYVFLDNSKIHPEWSRLDIIDRINSAGVPCFVGSCSEVYLEKAFESLDCLPDNRLPVAKELGESALMFLIHPSLTNKDIDYTCQVIKDTFEAVSLPVSN